MFTADDMKWGSYKTFEGPWFPGVQKFVVPENPTDIERTLAVVCSTEGGAWDAYNGYDVCICTSGLIQWCESGQYSVSDMFGDLAKAGLAECFYGVLNAIGMKYPGAEFRTNEKGRWRFFFGDERGEVDRIQEQRQLFYFNATGERGGWDEPSKAYAKELGAAVVNVWQSKEAQAVQAAYTAKRLTWFVMPEMKPFFDSAPDTAIGKAFQAAYLSFAGNNPTLAMRALKKALASDVQPPVWTLDWLAHVLSFLTFDPGVAIYPHRYDRIRPVLEKMYEIDLPDFSYSLNHLVDNREVIDILELQRGLIALNYDLGPAGADGVFGKKTRDAVIAFDRLAGLPDSDGMPTAATVRALGHFLEVKGIQANGGTEAT